MGRLTRYGPQFHAVWAGLTQTKHDGSDNFRRNLAVNV